MLNTDSDLRRIDTAPSGDICSRGTQSQMSGTLKLTIALIAVTVSGRTRTDSWQGPEEATTDPLIGLAPW